jgi:outer membrane protein TolC
MGSTPGSHRRCCSLGPAIVLLVLGAIGAGAAPPQAPAPRPAQAVTSPTGMSPFAPAPANFPSGPPSRGAVELPSPIPDASPPIPAGPELAAAAQAVPLVPGQRIEPIDLASALRLAGANNLDIAIAHQQTYQALADWQQARALWLPNLFFGPTWYRLDGQVQSINGQVITTSRNSLFLGGTAAMGGNMPAAPPGSGFPPVTGLVSILRISDAIFEPLAARQVAAARQAGIRTTTNDALLKVAEAYLDLQRAAGQLAIVCEGASHADTLVQTIASFTRSGAGLEADYRRSLAEQGHWRKQVKAAVGQLKSASAELIRQLHLDPKIVIAPIEPPETVIRLLPDQISLDDLIVQALHNRPELAEAQAMVQATLIRLRQAKLRPLIPSLALSYAGGGFGGGKNGFFGDFNSRGDAAVSLYWSGQNVLFTDRAVRRRSAAQQQTASLELMRVQDRVASEVVRANEERIAASEQIQEVGRALPEAINSLTLNFTNIRRGAGLPGATRPIEVLQPIQALAQARADYLDAVLAYNRAQFRLKRALGQP